MIYFVHGANVYSSWKYVSSLIDRFKKSDYQNTSFDLEKNDVTLAAVLNELSSFSLFSPKRLCIIKNPSKNKSEAKNIELLVSILEIAKKSEDPLIIFESSKIAKREILYSTIAKAKPTEKLFEPPEIPELIKWICSEFSSRGKRISIADAQGVADIIGDDMYVLENEIEKSSLFIGEENLVKLDQISHILTHGNGYKIWDLVDAIAKGDKKRVLTVFDKMYETDEDFIYLISMMAWLLRRLIFCYYATRPINVTSKSNFKFTSYSFDKCKRQAQLVGIGKLKALYSKLSDIDIKAKTGGINARFAITLLLSAI